MIDLALARLRAQQLSARGFETPEALVRHFGAVQAQDYLGALWAVGLRVPGATEASVERALAERKILRTWPMRGTLHFVAAEDARWLLELLAPALLRRHQRRMRDLGIDEGARKGSRKLFAKLLGGGKVLTRAALYSALDSAKISTQGQRGIHLLWLAAQEGQLCFAARQGKQQAFALLDEWAPRPRKFSREEALAELAHRYLGAHGPATLRDFTWWTGLPAAQAREALDSVSREVERVKLAGETYWLSRKRKTSSREERDHLLPAFDEYLVGYRDRSAVLDDKLAVNARGGMLAPTLVLGGRVAGTWRRTLGLARGKVKVELKPFGKLSKAELARLEAPLRRYGEFLGVESELAQRA